MPPFNVCEGGKRRKLGDGAYKVFFNAAEYAKIKNCEEKSFFRFLAEKKAETELTRSIEEKVSFARKNKEWRRQYMTWQQTINEEREIAFEDGIERGFERGIEQGIERARIEDAENLLKMGVGTVEQISQATGLSLEQVMQIKERIVK